MSCGTTVLSRAGVKCVVLGCQERGKPSDGPFDHATGKGWVKGVQGQYADAMRRRTQVNVVLVESTGGIARGTWTRMRRLGRRAAGKGSVDRTKYGRMRRGAAPNHSSPTTRSS